MAAGSIAAVGILFFFQAEDGIRDYKVTEFRRVLFRSSVPSRTYQASSSLRWRWRGAMKRGGSEGPPGSRHSAMTKSLSGVPSTRPESEGAMIGSITLKFPMEI